MLGKEVAQAVVRDDQAPAEVPGAPVWQRNYYQHIVRNQRELEALRRYLCGNPMAWEKDPRNPRPSPLANRPTCVE